MSHLSPERLAALLDDQPTAAELSHLTTCAACSRERGAYEALSEMSRVSRSTIGQPATSWERLGPALTRDGVIEGGMASGTSGRVSRVWLQAAAAVLLVLGGTVLGRVTAPSSGAVAAGPADSANISFASVDAAQRAAAESQNIYQASMAYIAAHDPASTWSTPAAIKTRLAALDQVTQITGAALENAPYDSVINNLYLNAQGQREASVRMLNAVSTRVTTY